MENNINIYLKSTDEPGTPSNPTSPGGDPNVENPAQPKNEKDAAKTYVMLEVGKYIAKQGFDYAKQHIGVWTGNSKRQEQINAALTGVGYLTAMAINPVLGGAAMIASLGTQYADYAQSKELERLFIERQKSRGAEYSKSRWG